MGLKRLSDPKAVRCYRINNGNQSRIYLGCRTDDLSEWCQEQADTTGCIIRMHDAEGVEVFRPTETAQMVGIPY